MSDTRKDNLVIGAVGDRSLHRYWLGDDADYDVYLIYFGDGEGYAGETKYHKKAKGFKYHLIKDVLDENPWIYDYKYVFLPDDDIYVTPVSVNRLFAMMADYNLELAQPSIMGWYGVEITLHQSNSLLRYTNWVEIMCPCFSSEALHKCQRVFKENNCGWSIETIWNVLLEHPRDKIAIIDDIVALHTRPVLTGDTHSRHEDPLNVALREAEEVYYKWALDKEMEKDAKVGQTTGGEIYCSVVYRQIKKPMEGGIPKQERFWPPCPFLESQMAAITSTNGQPILPCNIANPSASVSGSRRRSGKLTSIL